MRLRVWFSGVWLAATAALWGGSATALALPIRFEHAASGEIHGSLDGQPFTVSSFQIIAQADTANRQIDAASEVWFIDHSSAVITLPGVGELTLLTPTRTFVNTTGPVAGFGRASEAGIDLLVGPADPALAGWELLTGIGPVSAPGYVVGWSYSEVLTTAGVLEFLDGFADATLTATVPEPALSIPLVLGIAIALRRARL